MLSMKFKIAVTLLSLLAMVVIGCGYGDDDFADTPYIKEMIEKDIEGLYEPGLNNDGDSLFTADLSKSLAKNEASAFWKNALMGFRFARRDIKVERRSIDVYIPPEQDTLAFATVSYLLTGNFRVDSAGAVFSIKTLRHQLSRSITFVKRENQTTGERWKPITISSAYGSSLDPATPVENSRLIMDSIWIKTPIHTFAVDDPAEIISSYRNPVTVHNGDTIWIVAKVRNKVDALDKPIGFLTNGKNRDNQFRRRLEFARIPFSNYFVKAIVIDPLQKRGFNQLVIDFLTQSTITKGARPYDSYMIAIPYKVQ